MEEAHRNAGYPLAALSAERRAIANLRQAFTKAVCAVLELCCPRTDSQLEGLTDHGGKTVDSVDDFSQNPLCGPSHVATLNARGPPGMLVQMVCSGDDASVRCATTEYRLQKGAGQTRRHGGINHVKVSSSHGFDVDYGGSSVPAVAQATTVACTDANPNSKREQGADQSPDESQSHLLRVPVLLPAKPPTEVREALSIARDAAAEVQSFVDSICSINIDEGGGGIDVEASDLQSVRNSSGNSGGLLTGEKRKAGLPKGNPWIDTTATTRIVDTLRADTSCAQSLPTFVRNKLKGEAAGFGNQTLLK